MNILDSRLYSLLNKISNFFILNILWIVSCIPIITIVPATAGMFGVVRQWKLYQDMSVVRNYFHYFKENFKQSFLIGIIWTIIMFFLYLNYFYLLQDHSVLKYIIVVPLLLISLFFMATTAYIFSVITHYKVTWKDAIKNSFFVSVINFPITLLIFCLFVLIIITIIYFPITAFILISVGAYLNFVLCNHVFKKLENSDIRRDSKNVI